MPEEDKAVYKDRAAEVNKRRFLQLEDEERGEKEGTEPSKKLGKLSAFHMFMKEFKQSVPPGTYAPDRMENFKMMTKEIGLRWQAMPEEDKAVYKDRAAEVNKR